MSSALLSGAIWSGTVLVVLCCILSFVSLSFWTYRAYTSTQSQQLTHSKKKFVTLNAAGIGLFALATIFFALRLLLVISRPLNKLRYSDYVGGSLLLLLGSMIYMTTKYILYYVLYLRLIGLLKDTMFVYPQKTYTKVKYLIITNIICLILTFLFYIVPNFYQFKSQSTSHLLQLIAYMFVCLYIFSDTVICATLNILFVKKLPQIAKFIKSRKVRLRDHASDHKLKITNNHACDSESKQVSNKNTNNIKIVVSDKQSMKEKQLLALAAKYSILSICVGNSNIAVLLFFITRLIVFSFVENVNFDKHEGIIILGFCQWLIISIDCLINLLCLTLYFAFSDKLYRYICSCCYSTYCHCNRICKDYQIS